jgi:hypothetical protein
MMILKSNDYIPFLLNYPTLRWIILNIGFPLMFACIFLFTSLAFFVILLKETSNMGFLIPLIMLLVLVIIPYSHVRNGRISKQTLVLENNKLLVTNKLFPFRHTKKYNISNLQIDSVEPWNLLTGNSMRFKSKYARLIINSEVKLNNLYKVQELQKLIIEYKAYEKSL